MKTYIVRVKDDALDNIIENAKNELSKRKTAYAAIYGYQDANGKAIYFKSPLIKYSQNEVNEFVDGLRNGKKATDKVIYVIYRRHLDDANVKTL